MLKSLNFTSEKERPEGENIVVSVFQVLFKVFKYLYVFFFFESYLAGLEVLVYVLLLK